MALLLASAVALATGGCGRNEREKRPARGGEADQQIKRLRDDTETDLDHLRGQWLALRGLLTSQRDRVARLTKEVQSQNESLGSRLQAISLSLDGLRADIEGLRRRSPAPSEHGSAIERLARSYEELVCARRRGQVDSAAEVYRRYGFESAASWAAAWREAARDEDFERNVMDRTRRLCPAPEPRWPDEPPEPPEPAPPVEPNGEPPKAHAPSDRAPGAAPPSAPPPATPGDADAGSPPPVAPPEPAIPSNFAPMGPPDPADPTDG